MQRLCDKSKLHASKTAGTSCSRYHSPSLSNLIVYRVTETSDEHGCDTKCIKKNNASREEIMINTSVLNISGRGRLACYSVTM